LSHGQRTRQPRAAARRVKRSHALQRALGEISPKEFGQFIGENIRLIPVSVNALKAVPQVLRFYMGKNTPERREYIMKNLVDTA
jgi:topoisomerase-4 subunit B